MEIALAVGGAFLSSLFQVAFDRIASSRKFLDLINGNHQIKFVEETLDTLETTLLSLSMVLEDAEAKQPKHPPVEAWLGKLKTTMHEADDLLDELNTEYLILKVHHEFQPTDAYLALLKSDFMKEFTPNLKKITAKLVNFVDQIHVLGLQKFDPNGKGPCRAPSSSVVDKSHIFGRNDEKEDLIQKVLSDGGASDVSVIAITGMGGIGKTTLAQLVYDDQRVKDKFTTRAWVCVSEEYDARKITQALLMEVNSAVVDDKDDFNRLQVKLRDNLGREPFLIILDDIWNKKFIDWVSLKSPLNHGSRGSKIIVTTRDEDIASMMQNEPFHRMQPIAEEQSWSLFESYAFDNGECTLEFENIGKKIVSKCKGLPLAIKTVAGALRPKRDIDVWNSMLGSEIWMAGGYILPALSLSYMHLPSHLKPCFAFCALFPKDIPFDRDEVVLLWMANDLVQPSTQKVGCDYFDELKSRSLFEMVSREKYLMHDLVNDLARSIGRKSCIRLEDYEDASLQQSIQREKTLPPEILHFSYLVTHKDASRKFSGLAQAHNLRTFLAIQSQYWYYRLTTSFFSHILPKFRRLRSLSLSGYDISVVPDSIGDLKHLRLLNLARNNIIKLPNTIGKCMNLQTLILSDCNDLEELPQDMRYLINLLRLDIQGVGDHFIQRMDDWLCLLKDIQNLSILVDRIHVRSFEQLGKLQLCESLSITGLENVTVAGAKKVELKKKKGIKDLTLEWSGIAECSEHELNIFSILEPHTSIKRLTIIGYGGTRFADWLGNSAFTNLEFLHLKNCKNCYLSPPLMQLVALKELRIDDMDGITEVSEALHGNSTGISYLDVCGCPELVSIPNHVDILSIRDCPSFSLSLQSCVTKALLVAGCKNLEYPTSDSCNPYLERLTIKSCGDSIEGLPLCSFSKLKDLTIHNWESLKLFKFPNGYHESLTALNYLDIGSCNNILSFPEGGLRAPNLKIFKIKDCEKLKSLPEQMHTQLSSLEDLVIERCGEIECFPEGGLPSSLKSLRIVNCDKLMISQRNWDLQRLTSLSRVEISGFDNNLFRDEVILPSNLEHLALSYFPNLESLNGLQHLPSVQSLEIEGCPNLKSLNGLQHLPSLQSLEIEGCPNLKSLSGLQHLPSLQSLMITCPNLKSLNFPQHLPSLQTLDIRYCPNLKSLNDLQHLPSLQSLKIWDCPKLNTRIQREKGKDWPKVSHIPYIEVNWELIS